MSVRSAAAWGRAARFTPRPTPAATSSSSGCTAGRRPRARRCPDARPSPTRTRRIPRTRRDQRLDDRLHADGALSEQNVATILAVGDRVLDVRVMHPFADLRPRVCRRSRALRRRCGGCPRRARRSAPAAAAFMIATRLGRISEVAVRFHQHADAAPLRKRPELGERLANPLLRGLVRFVRKVRVRKDADPWARRGCARDR